MVVRKETQQTGVTVNQSAQWHARHGLRALSSILAMVLTMALMLLYAPMPEAQATESGNPTAETAGMVSIDSSTAVLTDTSGYHLIATVTNTTDQVLPAGTLTLAMNAFYTFVSRNDIQEWSEGTSPISTPNTVGETDVPSLRPGTSAKVSIDADADQQTLAAINSWGPKPVLLEYSADGTTLDRSHTFVTRTGDGLNSPNTPAMHITVAQPLAANGWTTDSNLLGQLVDEGGVTDAKLSKIAVPGKDDDTRLKSLEQVFAKHDMLQVVGDPTYLKSMPMPTQVDGITQPALFDMTAYSALDNESTYSSAGINDTEWNADSALRIYRSSLGDSQADTARYAWQGNGNWTLKALTKARQQGYDTVIATHDFEEDDKATVQTGKTLVSTNAGNVTVLSAQNVLSNLAQGKATSDEAGADGEGSDAGRLARFVAQSAFYQMEQPYAERNLLVCLNADSDPAIVEKLMTDIEQSPWLSLTDLATLKQTDTTADDETETVIPESDGLSDEARNALQQTLGTLANASNDIKRFNASILSKLDKKTPYGVRSSLVQWSRQLTRTHAIMALHALGNESPSRSTMAEGTTQLASLLINGVAITPTENVNVVSETAKMPVTISNSHPYPVKVKVSSLTDSTQIVTSRFDTVEVPAHGEAQVAFTIRVVASGTANATINLFDRNGVAFGTAQVTHITSTLQISDKSGFIIIGFAVLLGIVGLWRQFNRKKDPDE